MNVFYTNSNPITCAYDHCSVHVNKMIIEYAQILSTAHHFFDKNNNKQIYKATHVNHPSVIWARQSKSNYFWLFTLYKELCYIYYLHSGKQHKSSLILNELKIPPDLLPDSKFTEPPLAMPDEFKSNDTVHSYRLYIISKYNDWVSRERKIKVDWPFGIPYWIIKEN